MGEIKASRRTRTAAPSENAPASVVTCRLGHAPRRAFATPLDQGEVVTPRRQLRSRLSGRSVLLTAGGEVVAGDSLVGRLKVVVGEGVRSRLQNEGNSRLLDIFLRKKETSTIESFSELRFSAVLEGRLWVGVEREGWRPELCSRRPDRFDPLVAVWPALRRARRAFDQACFMLAP